MTLLDVAILVLFAGLLMATVLYETGPRWRVVRALFRLGLVPQWSFFAPAPGTQNLYLLYRDLTVDGDVTAWRVVHRMDESRGFWTFAWNPRRRTRKALLDLILALELGREEMRPDVLKLSTPYLLIIHHLSCLPRSPGAFATEFLVMVSNPGQPPRVAFQSERHRL
ncbi:hypothetical protein [Granulicoccus phenolivorans]|uniref:hypothetical protein n=1 Tax=Granulicoccus phenolivorans TaxID=266854 RepID=UPI000426F503|nr:hypothetical protein [Granulicoccus phenolivorans]